MTVIRLGNVTVWHGNNKDVMAQMIADGVQVDSVVCDPPYELGFMGKKWDSTGIAFDVEMWRMVLALLKPGGHLLAFAGSRTYHRMACAIEDAGFEIRDQIMWVYGSGFPKSLDVSKAVGEQWKGWGTALKPAHEPIVVARRPLIGTVATNVLTHGTGGLNIDVCRVGDGSDRTQGGMSGDIASKIFGDGFHKKRTDRPTGGRFPANLIHDGSDEVLACFPDAPGQLANASATAPSAKTSNVYGPMKREGEAYDTGNAARFFYCAKASKSDRGAFNDHPTVKPQSLMRYLCRLITPLGGVILDHFAGSGSTGLAALDEGFLSHLIEQDEHNVDVICGRVADKIIA